MSFGPLFEREPLATIKVRTKKPRPPKNPVIVAHCFISSHSWSPIRLYNYYHRGNDEAYRQHTREFLQNLNTVPEDESIITL